MTPLPDLVDEALAILSRIYDHHAPHDERRRALWTVRQHLQGRIAYLDIVIIEQAAHGRDSIQGAHIDP